MEMFLNLVSSAFFFFGAWLTLLAFNHTDSDRWFCFLSFHCRRLSPEQAPHLFFFLLIFICSMHTVGMSVFEHNRSYSRSVARHFPLTRARSSSDVWHQVEALTEEKRQSYLSHIDTKPWTVGSGSIFEFFMVVGVPRANIEGNRDNTDIHNRAFQPKILFTFPSKECAYSLEVPGFCFPNGVHLKLVEKTPSASNLLEHLFRSSRESRKTDSHVFMLNTPDGYLYGICIQTLDLFDNMTTFDSQEESPHRQHIRLQKNVIFTPTCYCFLTRNPYFDLFFDILEGIIGLEHLRAVRGHVCSEIIEHVNSLDVNTILRNTMDPPRKKTVMKRLSGPASISLEGLPSPRPGQDISESSDFVSDVDTSSSVGDAESSRKGESEADGTESPALSPENRTKVDYMKELLDALRLLYKVPPEVNPALRHIEFKASDGVISSLFPFPETRDLEASLLVRWAVPITLARLKPKTIIKLVTNVLLERPIVVHCPDLHVLGAVCVSMVPLLRPFILQSPFIPILPAKLNPILEAPVPFLVGVPNLPAEYSPKPGKLPFILLDVNSGKLILGKGMHKIKLPRRKELLARLKPVAEEITTREAASDPVLLEGFLENIARIFRTHFEVVFARLSSHTVTDVSDGNQPVAVFLKDSYLEQITSKKELAFTRAFFETQIFADYCDRTLQEKHQYSRSNPPTPSKPAGIAPMSPCAEVPESPPVVPNEIPLQPLELMEAPGFASH